LGFGDKGVEGTEPHARVGLVVPAGLPRQPTRGSTGFREGAGDRQSRQSRRGSKRDHRPSRADAQC
jgi:hypothetical protein